MGNIISTVWFDIGDRVCSTVMGYYLGLSGKVINIAQAEQDSITKYLIELDCGERITLKQTQIAYYIDN